MLYAIVSLLCLTFIGELWLSVAAAAPTEFTCKLINVTGNFVPQRSELTSHTWTTYQARGECYDKFSQISYSWGAKADFYDDGFVVERLGYDAAPNYVEVKMRCNADPWMANGTCSVVVSSMIERNFGNYLLLHDLFLPRAQRFGKPFSASFNHDIAALLAQKGAAAKLTTALNRNKPAPPLAQLMGPSIVSPVRGQQFLVGNTVPIKIAPPPGSAPIAYSVNVQRKDSVGQWVAHASIPIGAAQAHAPGGYTGWGSGGSDARSLAFLSSPGAWRLNTQVSSPKVSEWSDWVEYSAERR
jgi:hypothetical protein